MKLKPVDLRPGFIDRAVAVFAPQAAARRMAARVAMANMQRAYEGAARGRLTEGWIATSSSADAEIAAAGRVLRDRMRDLVRNNPLAAQAVQVLVGNIVGTGIRPRAASGDKALDERVNALWREWSARCDAHGHTDFHGLATLAVREMIEGGEVFALRRLRRERREAGRIPFVIELREADHLDEAARPASREASVRQGIEYDASGRRVAYWLFDEHPGDAALGSAKLPRSQRVPADRVAHLYERQRVQSRGVPWGAPAMRALRDLGDWQAAELVRKKTEACLVGVVFGAEEAEQGVAPSVVDADNRVIEAFEPGLIAYARGAKDIRFNQPGSGTGIREWLQVQMHLIAAGFRVPYALMTGDLSQTNFSSSRVGLNEFRRMVEQLQWNTVIPMFCEPVWDWFVEGARLRGLIPVDARVPAEWAPPAFESVNPLQDAQADLLEVRAGFSTIAQQVARRGYDPEEVMAEWRRMAEQMDALGLVFDSDPRRVTKAGLHQADAPAPADTD
ncbi:phage portal protein, lambda family [Meinhardsimonia xiamenensis]|jgi:lambda family phage portal protein|uniref:Phage portal protein, lambda family n=1 Tax=Meinhardsimonia xiamenensis TaxID=990712 RepID=A0A1G9HHY6_9RHOB|nr:phage portal protein [Meinhardsimonia xiamenensis]PRX27771.1 lambda family phage portal protein [Meinhardsimonia xiamenensis]SDL12631.1 phage portal protein, lambda family [Meinhardsimonia xiamenensis]